MSRVYEIDGKHYYSVTTILGMLDKPALVPWAAKMTAEACQQLIHDHGIHNCLEGTILLSWEDDGDGHMGLENIITEAKKAYRSKSRKAMDIGTLVHELIEKHCHTGIAPDLKDEPDEVQTAFNAWLKWVDENDFEPIMQEVQVHDPIVGYAGRFDAIAKVNGVVTILDFKTSSNIFDEYLYQLGAYWAAANDEEAPIHQGGILRLDKETGMPEWKTYTLEELDHAAGVFEHLCFAYRMMKGEAQPPKERKGKKNGADNK